MKSVFRVYLLRTFLRVQDTGDAEGDAEMVGAGRVERSGFGDGSSNCGFV